MSKQRQGTIMFMPKKPTFALSLVSTAMALSLACCVHVFAAAQSSGFAFVEPLKVPVSLPTTTGVVTGVCQGDFNGDGKPDMAVGKWDNGQGYVAILLGNGDGTFQPGQDIPIPQDANHHNFKAGTLLTRDFNRDGKLDIVLFATDQNGSDPAELLFYKGNGKGGFTLSSTTTMAQSPFAMETAELTSDGKYDIVTANAASDTVSVYLGRGDGTFKAPAQYTVANDTGFTATCLALADVDGKNGPDIVVGSWSDNSIFTFLNNGSGGFGTPIVSSTNNMQVLGLYAADFDNDGKTDVVAAGTGGPSGIVGNGEMCFMHGNGDGTFSLPASANFFPIVSMPCNLFCDNTAPDLNSDGNFDVVFGSDENDSNSLTVGLGDGKGNFNFQDYVASSGPLAGNGQVDASIPESLAFADFNGGGQLDIAVGSGAVNGQNTGGASLLLANPGNVGYFLAPGGLGTFLSPVGSPSPGARNFCLGNFFNDGNLDIAFLGSYNGVGEAIYGIESNGNGSYGPNGFRVDAPTASFANTLVAGDFNDDGNLDFETNAVGGEPGAYPSQIVAYGPAPDMTIGYNNPTLSGYAAVNTVVADFNNDQKSDFAVLLPGGNYQDDYIEVFCSTGSSFNLTATLNLGEQNYGINDTGIGVGDFTGDGRIDIVAHESAVNGNPDNLYYFKGNGDGTFKAPIITHPGLGEVVDWEVADLNNDNKMDLVAVDDGPGALQGIDVLLGNGNGRFQAPVVYAPGAYPQLARIVDLNGDGVPDIIFGGAYTGVDYMPGLGAGKFGPAISLACGSYSPVSFETGDTNKDGANDMVVMYANEAGNGDDFTQILNAKLDVTSLAPSTVRAGTAATVTIKGAGFDSSSVAEWNGKVLPTTFVSAFELKATIAAGTNKANLQAYPGDAGIIVVNTTPSPLASLPVTMSVTEPKPTITSLTPPNAVNGSGATALTVKGTDYVDGASIDWNGAPLPTTFVTAGKLTTTIPSADLASPGTASVSAVNPDGTTSTAATFTIN
jgi:hypothetical protein